MNGGAGPGAGGRKTERPTLRALLDDLKEAFDTIADQVAVEGESKPPLTPWPSVPQATPATIP